MTEQTDDIETGPAELGEKLSVILNAVFRAIHEIERLESGKTDLDPETVKYGLRLDHRKIEVLHQIEDDLKRLDRLDDALQVLSSNGKPRGGY